MQREKTVRFVSQNEMRRTILSEDFDSGFAEEIETITGSSDIYEKYGVKSAGLYIYDEVTTLDDYSR